MCSIIGYFGDRTAAPIIVNALKCMEYRGYDSVGIATFSQNQILVKKGSGKVAEVNSHLDLEKLAGIVGIGHTRWATHGKATSANAHPHKSSTNKVAIVHNGIIDNYKELKQKLQRQYEFKSETDSEVIANLLQFHLDKTGNVKESIIKSTAELKGNYAFVAMFYDGSIGAARFHEPLIIGIGNEGYFVSSDVLGFIEHTDEVIYPDNGEIVIINNYGMQIFDFKGKPVHHQITKISNEFFGSQKGNYAHYTLKEILEQPETILKACTKYQEQIDDVVNYISKSSNVFLTGSGTSYNSCLIAKHLFSNYAKLRIDPLISSEVPFLNPHFDENSLLIAISQSGESADVLEAVNLAKNQNCKITSIVNILTSSLTNLSSVSIGLGCGAEIGVAATKSFTSQMAVLYRIVDRLCMGQLGMNFHSISKAMSDALKEKEQIQKIAESMKDISDIYVLGRGIHYPIACEAALKLKELTYIHAEGLPGGELKHGPLALMDSSVFVIVINPTDMTFENTIASIHEIKARNAKIIGISDKPNDMYDYWIRIPKTKDEYFPFIEIIPIQLLSYYTALEKNADPDYPRNLAKSVTVK